MIIEAESLSQKCGIYKSSPTFEPARNASQSDAGGATILKSTRLKILPF